MSNRKIRRFVTPADVRRLVGSVENGDLFLMHDGRIYIAEALKFTTSRVAFVHFRNIINPCDSITDTAFCMLPDSFEKIGTAKDLVQLNGFEGFGDWGQWRRINGIEFLAKTPVLDLDEAKRSAEVIASLSPNPRKPWYRRLWPFDIERAAVVAIAIFVAWIAADHFRQVNARIDAMKANAVTCGDRGK